jgi:hypothetical protein
VLRARPPGIPGKKAPTKPSQLTCTKKHHAQREKNKQRHKQGHAHLLPSPLLGVCMSTAVGTAFAPPEATKPPPRPTSVRPDQPRRRGARVPPALRGPPGLSPCLPTSQGPPPRGGGGGLTPAVQRGHRAGVLALQSSGCVWSSHRARLPNNHRAHLPTNHKQYENQHGPKGPSRSSTKHLLTQARQNYPQAPRGTRTLAYLLTQLFRSPAPQDELIKRVQGHRYKK